MKKAGGVLLVLGASFAFYSAAIAPWAARWGATAAEEARPLPGDDVIAGAATSATRAITIDAAAPDVWGWLAQTGQDRAGFYSYRILENAVGARMPATPDRIHPELGRWALGDKLWMYPPDRARGMGNADLVALEPGRALAFGTWAIGTSQAKPHDGSWTFVVEPIDGDTSRLLVRSRALADPARPLLLRAVDRWLFEPMHFVMERKMMTTMRDRAEGVAAHPLADAIEPAFWAACVLVLLASIVAVFRREDWGWPLGIAALSALAFMGLTFTQPGPVVGAIVVAALILALVPPSSRERERRRAERRESGRPLARDY